jgi:hypothetical protein
MARKLMLVSVGVLSLCFATAVQAQILVGTLGQHQWPTGCVTIFSGVPFDVFNNSVQIPPMSLTVATSGGGGIAIFPGINLQIDDPVVDLACATGVSVDAFGILKATGGYHLPDGTILTSASQLAAPSGSHVWSSFALAFFGPYTVSTFTPDNNITVTRIQAQLPIAPTNCQTNAAVGVISADGANFTAPLTLSALANDSGSMSVNFNGGTAITLKVSTPARCSGGIPPGAANIVVQYKVRP